MTGFSFRSRQESLKRFAQEEFDILVVGGGITGAAAARDAVSRGLKVAVVERGDFASGTSSRSSKLIHGGLRYLENFEFGLVFEALSERALLLKTAPHLVRPLPFFLPVYKGDPNGRAILGMGLWLYDLLALFRTPGFHKSLSRKKFISAFPFIKLDGLLGGFRYYDASMWDDVLAVETLRSAHMGGAAIANYTEAVRPIWQGDLITGFTVRDLAGAGREEISLRAKRVIVCAGPWTDEVGHRLLPEWRNWLTPSKGVHLIFEASKIPVPGAMVMAHPEDGRIAFVIPRPDFGAGVVIVGTTDGPAPSDPNDVKIEQADVDYLLGLLAKYFPSLGIKASDILSGYVGVRPLFGEIPVTAAGARRTAGISTPAQENAAPSREAEKLQKVSREHHIGEGPGGTVVVAGGKYTTHRKMAEEILDYTLKQWKKESKLGLAPAMPAKVTASKTRTPVNTQASPQAIEKARAEAHAKGTPVPEELFARYGAEALDVFEIAAGRNRTDDPAGFPLLEAQLRHTIRNEMVMKLEDFFLRRLPLFASRADHGLPWAEALARTWAEERGLGANEAHAEVASLQAEFGKRMAFTKR